MRVIERLLYKFATELFGNRQTSTVFPEYVLQLRHTGTCPYCGDKLRSVYFKTLKIFMTEEEGGYDERYECPSCNWWRRSWVNDNYFGGFTEIGILHKTSDVGAKLKDAVNELLLNNEKIFKLDTKYFEEFVGKLLREFYDCEVIHVGKSHDGGIDLILLESNDGKVPIQVKRRTAKSKVESVSLIREMRGAMVVAGYNKGMIVTTADHFSKEAIEISVPKPEHLVPQTIDLIDCRRLLDVMGLIVTGTIAIEKDWNAE